VEDLEEADLAGQSAPGLGGLGVPAEGIGTASHRILVFSLILDNVN